VATVFVSNADGVATYVRYRERLGIVHRPGARYAGRLRQLGIAIGECPLCGSAAPIHEIVHDPTHGEVHVHRERLGTLRSARPSAA
jgi:hypothetical protein